MEQGHFITTEIKRGKEDKDYKSRVKINPLSPLTLRGGTTSTPPPSPYLSQDLHIHASVQHC